MAERTNLIFPVENETRELDSRLVMAGLHATKNRRFFIGAPGASYRIIPELGGAVYLGKHILTPTAMNPVVYFDAKQRGVMLVHLSEEGGVFPGQEESWKWWLKHQLEASVLHEEDIMCTWGDFQTKYYVDDGARCEVRTTGHPRFDLCTARYRDYYRAEVDAIKARHGDFVLINTSFGFAFNPMGIEDSFSESCGYFPEDDFRRMTAVSAWKRAMRGLGSMVAMIHKLSIMRRDVQFIIRPHPSEELDSYKVAFNGVPNIHVVREGNSNAWVLASKVLVHDGSTSGLEAHFLDRPCVNFHETDEDDVEVLLTRVVGSMATTQAAAVDAVLSALDTGKVTGTAESDPRAPTLLRNLAYEDSTDLVLRALADAERRLKVPARAPDAGRIDREEWKFIAIEEAKHLVRPLSKRRFLSARHFRWNTLQFDNAKVERLLEKVKRVTGTTFSYRVHARHLVELWSDREKPAIEAAA